MRHFNVLFVCLGNICRSPMAEYVFRHIAAENNTNLQISSASAGTSGWHNGENMHRSTAQILKQYGIDSSVFTSSKVSQADFDRYDFIIAMDDQNLADLEKLFGRHPEKIFKLTDLLPDSGYNYVPDPWYTHDFEETYRLTQAGSAALLKKLNQIAAQ